MRVWQGSVQCGLLTEALFPHWLEATLILCLADSSNMAAWSFKARKTVCLEVTIFRDSTGGCIRRSSQTGQLLPVARADSRAVTPVRLRALVCFAPSPLPRWL